MPRTLTMLLSLALCAAGCAGAQSAEPREPRCRILLTNDDGIDAPGIRAARHALSDLCEVLVVAPARDQSGAGHGIANTSGGTQVRKVALDSTDFGYAV